LITAVQDQISATSAALEVLRKRQHILQIAIDRAEVLEPIIVQPEEGRSGKGRRKGGNGPTEDKQCGWDPRLIWEDEAVQSWMEGQDEEEICGLAKRRCDKHQGWQKTSAFSLETEERQLVSRSLDHVGQD
jgi:COMPASS component SPP1